MDLHFYIFYSYITNCMMSIMNMICKNDDCIITFVCNKDM